MTDLQKTGEPGRGHFLGEGFREMGRKLARSRTRRTMRQQEAERAVALTALGQRAWEGKIDLAAFADLRDSLAALDARAGELSETTNRLGKEKEALDLERRAELEKFAARRKAVEERKSPVDAALREARSRKAACEQSIRQAESRLAAIAGRLTALDRDIASPGAAAGPDAQQKLAAAQSERAKLAAEQGGLGPKVAASREELPRSVAEESRLAAESQKHAAEIAAIDAEQKATVAHIDANLRRVQSETQGASKQSGAVQSDRAATFRELGKALYDAAVRDPLLAEPTERVASIDRGRALAESALDASLAETRLLASGTMAKFWGVMLGVPIALAAMGIGTWQYLHRNVPAAAAPQPVAQAKTGACETRNPPESGTGVGVRSDCTRTEGTFANGHLQSGKVTYPDGRVREGNYVGGQQIGMGKLTWRDGRRYEGMFVEGRSSGPGVYVTADGTRFSGMFQPGVKLTGIGTRKSPDGSVLVGEFVNGQPSRKMVLVKDGKAEVVELGDSGAPAKGTATVEANK